MALQFFRSSLQGSASSINTVYLSPDNWDDFGHKTLFFVTLIDGHGQKIEIGNVKIGYVGQDGGWTTDHLPNQFDFLSETFYSLGQDPDYYRNLMDKVSKDDAENILHVLGDVVYNEDRRIVAEKEQAFNTSLLRTINRSTIDQQFRRILNREAALTSYNFYYEKEKDDFYSGVRVEFKVVPESKPPTNIHILIGRNGVGKTTLLNNMVEAFFPKIKGENPGCFYQGSDFWIEEKLTDSYFSGIVSVSFSAFDPFKHPDNQNDPTKGLRYNYIGLKKYSENNGKRTVSLKDEVELSREFLDSLLVCLALVAKKKRWLKAVEKLESDVNFADMELRNIVARYDDIGPDGKDEFCELMLGIFGRMSSGHAIVLLTITRLVETVDEKTLVLLDEPESHLHPPLLSAFTRALSDLLTNRNGVAIIATHSPVVLQEVPRSCVSILRRVRLEGAVERPESETFAENVGVLTREVFGLEVTKSGFHDFLIKDLIDGKSFEQVMHEYDGQLGFEGKAIYRALLANKIDIFGKD